MDENDSNIFTVTNLSNQRLRVYGNGDAVTFGQVTEYDKTSHLDDIACEVNGDDERLKEAYNKYVVFRKMILGK